MTGQGDGSDPPQPPKRRRKPPRGLEGFDTGFPEDAVPAEEPPVESGPRKRLWSDPESTDAPLPGELPAYVPEAAPPASTDPQLQVPDPTAGAVVTEWGTPPTTDPTATAPATGPTATGPTATAPATRPTTTAPATRPTATTSGPAAAQATRPTAAPATGSTAAPATGPIAAAPATGPIATAPATGPIATPADMAATMAPRSGPTPLMTDGDLVLPQHAVPDLREAAGVTPKKKRRAPTPLPVDAIDDFDDDGTGGRRSRKMIAVAIGSLIVGLGVAALVFLGRANSAWFYIACEPDKIVAERGRAFPPWGTTELEGKPWAAIKIPPEAECIALETEDEEELAAQYRTILIKRASVLLTAKEVTKIDDAKALLEQALLHARADTDGARTARNDIQRLLGDVVYWRASLKMRDATKTLLDAAKEFDAAAQQRPRHVTDASAWAEYVRKIVTQLEGGPAGTEQATFPPTPPPAGESEPRPPAPPGVALPVEPDDAGTPEMPPPTPDAGIPTGGVLL